MNEKPGEPLSLVQIGGVSENLNCLQGNSRPLTFSLNFVLANQAFLKFIKCLIPNSESSGSCCQKF